MGGLCGCGGTVKTYVVFQKSDMSLVTVCEGGIIGRAVTAQLRLSDADISEAHAIVSRRGEGLQLLALRGRVWVAGQVLREVELRAGLELVLGAQLRLVVVEVCVAETSEMPPTLGEENVVLSFRSGMIVLQQNPGPPLVLSGNLGDLVRLLSESPSPVYWTVLSGYFWPERDQAHWRQRFDAMIKELRSKLRDHHIRAGVLQSQQGAWWLQLKAGD